MTRCWPGSVEISSALLALTNWGRWGRSSDLGTLNLVDAQARERARAAMGVRPPISLARDIDPAQEYARHEVTRHHSDSNRAAGYELESLELRIHGVDVTHLDALSHVWDERGAWDGTETRGHDFEQTRPGGAVDAWRAGIWARCHLLDVPRHRGSSFVEPGTPVTNLELDAIVAANGLDLEPGDAIAVYSGREAYTAAHDHEWGKNPDPEAGRPGLHVSCLEFLRRRDCSALVWDMMDAYPHDFGLAWGVHLAIPLMGLSLIDNADLSELATACADQGSYTFALVVAPLPVLGGTGSPANPLAFM